jgi:hypothetical protein
VISKDAIYYELMVRQKAANDFLLFVKYTKRDFIINWHHKVLGEQLQSFAEGNIKKLMIFLPPQVGKSEMSTRRLPSYLLGKYPDKKIAVCAYNQTFASKFNRDIQRIIEEASYQNIFPNTRLNNNDGYIKNSEEFEIVDHKGYLKTVGIGGALTGSTVDIGIIDDPIKDAMEAYSHTFRDRVWDWYNSVFITRLHNQSQQLITLTRWHEDDLAGRIMKNEKDWEVIILPAIREDYLNEIDVREIGEAIWPEKHSLERMLDIKKKNPLIFSSLYQQRPYYNEEEGRFAFAFSRQKHVGRCFWNPAKETYLSFDFNRNPICCSVIQWYDDTIFIPRCIKLKNSNIYSLCELLIKLYPTAVFIVTGDATGRNSTAMVQDNINYYIIIKKLLNLNDGQLKVNAINPSIEANQVLLNALLQNYKWCIDEENASAVIFDMEYVKMLPNGTIDKGSRTDPTKQADAIDTIRYWCDKFMKWFLEAQSEIPVSPRVPSPQEYFTTVRAEMLSEANDLIEIGDSASARTTLNEVQRLDKLFKYGNNTT